MDETQCRAAYAQLCVQYAADVDAWIAAGRVTYNAQHSGECADGYRQFFNVYQQYQCGVPGAAEALGALYGLATSSATGPNCQNGVLVGGNISGTSPFVACERMLEGQVAPGTACESYDVCRFGSCEGLADGGCGRCTEGEGPSGPLEEGDTCVVERDGGPTTTYQCSGSLRCDSATGRCVQTVGAGETCQAASRACSGICGYRCSNVDGGAGTCVPKPADGEPCGIVNSPSAFRDCQRGLTCVTPTSDAGVPDYQAARCEPHARRDEPCSVGFNYDQYVLDMTGGFTYGGRHPVCEVGLTCVTPDGGTDGICSGGTATTDCNPYTDCPTAGEVCRMVETSYRCIQPRAEGEPCTPGMLTECMPNLRCRSHDGGSSCGPPLAAGQPCADDYACQVHHQCNNGVCTPISDLPYPASPMCQ